MTDPAVIAQIFNCSALAVLTAFCLWRYKATISARANRQAFQYQFFRLRDDAIRLVVEGRFSESNRDWKLFYTCVNRAAHAATVDQMCGGVRFVLTVLKQIRLPTKDQDQFDLKSVPEPLQELWVGLATTMILIVVKSSLLIRLALSAASRVAKIRHAIKKRWPSESQSYIQWQECAQLERAA